MLDIDGFRNYLFEDELSPNTVRSYLCAVRQYSTAFPEISKANLIAYKQSLMMRCAPSTVNLRMTALLAYCRYAGIPMKIRSVKEPKKTHIDNVITQEQLDRLLNGLRADHNTCWTVNILLLSKTGMRISEALRITKRDVLTGHVTVHTKAHMRTIYFPRSLIEAIRPELEQLRADAPVMRSRWGHPIRTARGVAAALKRFADRYGIPREVMYPHSFRHFFAIEFLKRKNDIALLADILGHCNVSVTQIYLRQSQEQQQEAVDEAVSW